ncbi:rCG44039 [Rattus norvegicus]|uniref:RCG44039 n=1 Tax=Rattus norvegicus TaxID=10116 RepID=A6J762_RAT|nr:rCG44039 [Rattus norvegicus]
MSTTFPISHSSWDSPSINKIVPLVLLTLTGESGVGETKEEDCEDKHWHQCLENDFLWVENPSSISPRRDRKQRAHAEKHMENPSKNIFSWLTF